MKRTTENLLGVGVALVAFVTYVLTLSAGAYPGESANLICCFTGLSPKLGPEHPLWGSLVWLLSQGPATHLVFRLNFLSALFGAASVWLMYRLVSNVVFDTIDKTPANELRATIAARAAGLTSSICLAFSVPFWIVSTRAHYAAFDVFLLLAIAELFRSYFIHGRSLYLYSMFLLYGAGVAESATLIAFAPLFAIGLVVASIRKEEFPKKQLALAALIGSAGLTVYPLAAWFFYGTAGYELKGYNGFFQVIWFLWRDQGIFLAKSLPQSGWLIVLATTTIPWLTCLAIAKRGLNEERDWSFYVLHLVLTALTIAVVVNVSFAPWPLLGFSRLLVTPYVLMASVFGYLVAYWFLLPGGWTRESEGRVFLFAKRWCGLLFLVPLMGFVVVAPFRNFAVADGRDAAVVNKYARSVVGSMEGRSWLVTDGFLDYQFMIAAREMSMSLQVLNLHAGNNELYMKHVALLMSSARLKNACDGGMIPLLREWLSTDAQIASKLAVLSLPDVLMLGGYIGVPSGFVFVAARSNEDGTDRNLLSEHKAAWSAVVRDARLLANKPSPLTPIARRILQNQSLMANNLGVILEDRKRDSEAFSAYAFARDLDPRNISALLNQSLMIDGGYKHADSKQIKQDINSISLRLKNKPEVWSLSQAYGYVRAPEAFAIRGWQWARSGQHGMAIPELRRAVSLLSEEKQAPLKEALAALYSEHNKVAESEELYDEMLMEDPEDSEALLGLANLRTRQEKYEEAKKLLGRAESSGAQGERVAVEKAILAAAQGHVDSAAALLEEYVGVHPDKAEAWRLLLTLTVKKNSVTALEKLVGDMRDLKGSDLECIRNTAAGHLCLAQKSFDRARAYFELALQARNGNSQVLDMLLRLDLAQGRKDAARGHMKDLLLINPDHALALYVKGSIQLETGDLDLAEDSFLRSVKSHMTSQACNNLAWLLNLKGEFKEAEEMAKAALKLDEGLCQAWDTLGVIYYRTGRLEEAEEALGRAVAMSVNNMRILLHSAELQLKKGNREQASKQASMVLDKPGGLSVSERERASEILRLSGK